MRSDNGLLPVCVWHQAWELVQHSSGLEIPNSLIASAMRNGEGPKLIQYIIAQLAMIFVQPCVIFIRKALRFWEGVSY